MAGSSAAAGGAAGASHAEVSSASAAVATRVSIHRTFRPSHPLDDGRDALAQPDAHRLQPVAPAASLQLVQERGHEPGAAAAERVAESDGATVDVDARHVGVQLALPGQ